MKTLALALTTLLPLAAQAPAADTKVPMAQATPRGHEARRGERLARVLELTPTQRTQVQELRLRHRAALEPKLQAARSARQSLAEALRDPATPEAKLKERFQQASEAKFQLLLAARAHRAELAALLTPAQRERALALRAAHREHVRGRMERTRMRFAD